MVYKEIHNDLFNVPEDYWKVQCISADLAMGKGIATVFNQKYNMKNKMKECYGKSISWNNQGMCRFVLGIPVFNLITKPFYFSKPTLITLKEALLELKWYCLYYDIKKIAMPKIGCGLDQLKWSDVKELIKEIFSDMEIEILVCIL